MYLLIRPNVPFHEPCTAIVHGSRGQASIPAIYVTGVGLQSGMLKGRRKLRDKNPAESGMPGVGDVRQESGMPAGAPRRVSQIFRYVALS